MQEITKKTLITAIWLVALLLVLGVYLDQRNQIDDLNEQLGAMTSDKDMYRKDWLQLEREYDELEKSCPPRQ